MKYILAVFLNINSGISYTREALWALSLLIWPQPQVQYWSPPSPQVCWASNVPLSSASNVPTGNAQHTECVRCGGGYLANLGKLTNLRPN